MQNPLIVALVFVFAAVMIAVFVGAVYVMRRWVGQRLPEPVLQRGRQNALICAVGALAVFGLLSVLIWSVFEQSIVTSVVIAFGVFWVVVFTWFIAAWFVASAAAGPLLLDCGPHPTKNLFWFSGAFFLLFFGGGNLVGLFDEVSMSRIGGMLFGVTGAVYYAMMASGRLQIRENGIWQFWGLLKWDRVQSFEWVGNNLMLQARTRIPGLGKGALPVPAEHREAIDSLLSQRLSQNPVLPTSEGTA